MGLKCFIQNILPKKGWVVSSVCARVNKININLNTNNVKNINITIICFSSNWDSLFSCCSSLKFIFISLECLVQLKDHLKKQINEADRLLSVAQQKCIRSMLERVVRFGISANLLPYVEPLIQPPPSFSHPGTSDMQVIINGVFNKPFSSNFTQNPLSNTELSGIRARLERYEVWLLEQKVVSTESLVVGNVTLFTAVNASWSESSSWTNNTMSHFSTVLNIWCFMIPYFVREFLPFLGYIRTYLLFRHLKCKNLINYSAFNMEENSVEK